MPLQATSGAASYDAFGGGVPVAINYIEDVFSTYLYTGTGASQTITNGVDLSGKGGLVWFKNRTQATFATLFDTVRGATQGLIPSETYGNITRSDSLTSFNSNGFTLGVDSVGITNATVPYVSWTFREQPKFFDVVTYTGNGTAGRTVAHSLGSTPACIIVKAYSVDTGDYWGVYHRSLGATKAIFLSATNAAATSSIYWNNTAPTSTNFTVGDWSGVNQNGTSYVAYIFAHDAGGFGLTGTDNVISCGSYTTDGDGLNSGVSLGYEPQWIMYKRTDSSSGGGWYMQDNMRGMTTDGAVQNLFANTSAAESSGTYLAPTATGFKVLFGQPSATYIYIAIRRGQMKVPTDGTKVFASIARTGTGTAVTVTGIGFTPDASIAGPRGGGYTKFMATSRPLNNLLLTTSDTAAGYSDNSVYPANIYAVMDGINQGGTGALINGSGNQDINWFFKRASGFFDVVCYTGTGSNTTVTHNLGVVPELMIVKVRTGSAGESWTVWNKTIAASNAASTLWLNSTSSVNLLSNRFNSTAPTSSVFSLGNDGATNGSTWTYVAYLFATCAGVSKVGSYTGNGTTQTIDCGFTGGARFVLIKRTDSTGDWYTYDTARGMTVLTDPYLFLNTTAAETATLGSVTTVTTGFALNSTILAAINVSAASYIFLAIA